MRSSHGKIVQKSNQRNDQCFVLEEITNNVHRKSQVMSEKGDKLTQISSSGVSKQSSKRVFMDESSCSENDPVADAPV